MNEPRSSYAASTPSFGREVAWNRACLQCTGEEVNGERDYGVRKQRVKSMKWVHNSLGLTSSVWRQVAWSGACLQSTGEEVKGSKLLENKKLSILTRTWICSLKTSGVLRPGSFVLTWRVLGHNTWHRQLQFRVHMSEPRSSYAASYSIFWKRSRLKWGGGEVKGEGTMVWGNKALSPWSEFIIRLGWLHQREDK